MRAWNFTDLTGQRFGRLLAMEFVGIGRNHKSPWRCQCDCGAETTALASNLKRRLTTSCGCRRDEACSDKATTHGLASPSKGVSSIYKTWAGMMRRCNNPNEISYPHYGGRGIKVCERWKDAALFAQDMGEKPSPELSIERRDGNKDYCPENCYWGTEEQQANNRRNNVRLTFNGKTQTATQWERELNFPKNRITYRLRSGWTPERALTEPVHKICHR